MAHPSTLEVACGHGVFVLDKTKEADDYDEEHSACSTLTSTKNTATPDKLSHRVHRVLQKPTLQLMNEECCVYRRCPREDCENEAANNAPDTGDEFAYTDSCYFMDSKICISLLKFVYRF